MVHIVLLAVFCVGKGKQINNKKGLLQSLKLIWIDSRFFLRNFQASNTNRLTLTERMFHHRHYLMWDEWIITPTDKRLPQNLIHTECTLSRRQIAHCDWNHNYKSALAIAATSKMWGNIDTQQKYIVRQSPENVSNEIVRNNKVMIRIISLCIPSDCTLLNGKKKSNETHFVCIIQSFVLCVWIYCGLFRYDHLSRIAHLHDQ